MIIFGGWHNIGIGSALKDGKSEYRLKENSYKFDQFFGRATYSFKKSLFVDRSSSL